MLVAGIQRHLREMECLTLGDKGARFARTRGALDACMKHLSVNNRESSKCWMPPSSKPLPA